jgi:hypothetical protein
VIQTYSPYTILCLVSREEAIAAGVGKCECILIRNCLAGIDRHACVEREVCHRATVESPANRNDRKRDRCSTNVRKGESSRYRLSHRVRSRADGDATRDDRHSLDRRTLRVRGVIADVYYLAELITESKERLLGCKRTAVPTVSNNSNLGSSRLADQTALRLTPAV